MISLPPEFKRLIDGKSPHSSKIRIGYISPDFNKTEFFFNIDFPPGALGLLVECFFIYPLSSPNPKFYLTSLLITSFPLPKILCSLP
jgi:hypothetical protein